MPRAEGVVSMVAAALPESEASLSPLGTEPLLPDSAPVMREIFVCYFCESEFASRQEVTKHQKTCRRQSSFQKESLKEPLPVFPCSSLSRMQMAELLYLVPKSRIEHIRRKSSSNVVSLELDLDKDDQVVSAKAPCTPKPLIWQRSREMSPPSSSSRRLFGTITSAAENSDNDEEDMEDEKEKKAPRKRHKLLSIDLSSPLGTRLADCVCAEAKLREVLKCHLSSRREVLNYDEDQAVSYHDFCRTPTKKQVQEKQLRNRLNNSVYHHFPIVFKPRRKSHLKHIHILRLTKADRREFCKTFDAGMNSRARDLFKETIDCKIKLKKLTTREIEKHTQPDVHMVPVHNFLRPPHPATRFLHPHAPQWYDPRLSSRHAIPSMMSSHTFPPEQLMRYKSFHPGNISHIEALRKLSLPPGLFGDRKDNITSPIPSRSEVICISDDDDDNDVDDDVQVTGAFSPSNFSPKPTLKPPSRVEKVLFRCHLCAMELAFGNDESYIISRHFEQKHGVLNIELVQGTSKDGRRLISIVEKAVRKPLPKKHLLPHQRPGPKCKKIVPPLEDVIVLD